MTATPFCIIPVTSLNGTPIGSGKMGEITQSLLDTWSKNVGIDIVDQIRTWDTEELALSVVDSPSPYTFTSEE